MGNLKMKTLVLGQLQTNCYLIINDETKEVLIADPAENAALIKKHCDESGLKPKAILLTHGHFDHIAAADELKTLLQVPVYAAENERRLLSDININGSAMMNINAKATADKWVNDGDRLDLAGFVIKVISTPGHTKGSVCYYIETENVLISGDTLFLESYGRTDFPTGNNNEMIESINIKLFTLPDNTAVYPGHGMKTEIGYEKENNPIKRI